MANSFELCLSADLVVCVLWLVARSGAAAVLTGVTLVSALPRFTLSAQLSHRLSTEKFPAGHKSVTQDQQRNPAIADNPNKLFNSKNSWECSNWEPFDFFVNFSLWTKWFCHSESHKIRYLHSSVFCFLASCFTPGRKLRPKVHNFPTQNNR